jgi:Leucine-rich repeat (LRR) protein
LFGTMVATVALFAMAACDKVSGPDFVDVSGEISDAAFSDYCQSQMIRWDGDGDGKLSREEAARVTRIDVAGTVDNAGKIVSLEGIGYFTGLVELICDYNAVTVLDLSANTALVRLDCHANEIASLDVSRCAGLRWLSCGYNRLTELDVSNNPALAVLYCNDNNLASLDVSKNTGLIELLCHTNPVFMFGARSDVSHRGAPVVLSSRNGSLEPVTVRDLTRPAVTMYGFNTPSGVDLPAISRQSGAAVRANRITELDVSKNTGLIRLSCYGNLLTELDVSDNTVLRELNCWGNDLAELDVSGNVELVDLTFWLNPITEIDLSKNIALVDLNCGDTDIAELDVSNNVSLVSLGAHCNYGQMGRLTALDVSNNAMLTELYCYRNRITGLDLSNNVMLTEVACADNLLAELDVSNNVGLTLLDVGRNLLGGIDITNNRRLNSFYCSGNPGDDVSRFPVKAWFDNGSIPTNVTYFESSEWSYSDKTIRAHYFEGDTGPHHTSPVIAPLLPGQVLKL